MPPPPNIRSTPPSGLEQVLVVLQPEVLAARPRPRCLGFLLAGRLRQHLGVQRRGDEQLGVRAVGDDLAAVEQDDPVGQADGGEPVGDDQRGAPLHQDAQGAVDALLDLDVDGARGVVEDQDGRVDEQGPGDGDALALAARQRVPPFADHGVVPLGQVADEPGGAGGLGGRLDLVHGRVGPPVGDVVPDRHGEEERLVEDDADVRPQAGERQVAHVVAVDAHRTAGHVVEAGEEPGQGRLAAAGASDHGDGLARPEMQVEVAQHVAPAAPVFVVGLGEQAVRRRRRT